jgi:hypothetical protein
MAVDNSQKGISKWSCLTLIDGMVASCITAKNFVQVTRPSVLEVISKLWLSCNRLVLISAHKHLWVFLRLHILKMIFDEGEK